MKKIMVCFSLVFSLLVFSSAGSAQEKGAAGEALFKKHCAACHPNGGNIMNPQKTLSKKDREANKLATAQDIVNVMRNPGPGMPRFDKKTLPDSEAKKIADYIMKTYK